MIIGFFNKIDKNMKNAKNMKNCNMKNKLKNTKIPKVQTFSLSVNPKNGTVVIPKLARERLKISSTHKSVLTLRIYDNDTAEIKIPKYTLEDVLYNLPPILPPNKLSNADLKKIAREAIVDNYITKNL